MFITTVDYIKNTNFGSHIETTEAWDGFTEKESMDKCLLGMKQQNIPGDMIVSITTKQVESDVVYS